MSANNQSEPAAALAASSSSSAAAAAAAAASVAVASEYLKRTCLICGCQTNQAINIYEPRSGPNIVQLIQAKFKFQPLNEDKFLCFSCNNWLINWHSLQALNSNDAESQSRSQSPSQMGNNSSAGLVQQQQQQQQHQQQQLQQAQPVKIRPVAQVRPQPKPQPPAQPQSRLPAAHTPTPTSPPPALCYSKRCRLLRRRRSHTLAKQTRRPPRRSLCRESEREACKWRVLHRRSLAKVAQLQRQLTRQQAQLLQQQQQQQPQQHPLQQQQPQAQRLVKAAATPTYQRLPAPRVDGKVVAMFRRLGTTLSREQAKEETEEEQQQQQQTSTRLPLRIMSPAKQRPRWTRELEDDEILLEFDRAIGEVLPTTARRRLTYDECSWAVEREEVAEEEQQDLEQSACEETHQTDLQLLQGLQLPQGLSITLI